MTNAIAAAIDDLWNALDAAADDVARGTATMRFERAERRAHAIVVVMGSTVAGRFGTETKRQAVVVVREILLRG